ncbi:MAG: TIGR04086 family membrane protein [Lachnospiraceae bacterium]|nr:TIGR04086 family membrane protein [Lachnospiraceae bacterium]
MNPNPAINPGRFLKTLLLSYAVTVVLLFLLAFIIYKMKLNASQASMGVTLIYLISCAMGGFITGKQMRSRRLLWGLLSGALYFSVLLLLSLATGSGFSWDMKNLMTVMASCLAGSAAGAFIS